MMWVVFDGSVVSAVCSCENELTPTQLVSLQADEIVDAAAGTWHSLLCTSEGVVYGAGATPASSLAGAKLAHFDSVAG